MQNLAPVAKFCILVISLILYNIFNPFILDIVSSLQAEEKQLALQKVVSNLRKIQSFRADLQITTTNGVTIGGVFSYQGGKVNLQLDDGRVIATNGIYMIAYNPVAMVAGKQLVEEKVSGGLSWILNDKDYEYEFLSNNEVLGRAKKEGVVTQELQCEWDDKYMLRSLAWRTRSSKEWFRLRLVNMREFTNFSPALFSYRPPTGSRTVENVLKRRN